MNENINSINNTEQPQKDSKKRISAKWLILTVVFGIVYCLAIALFALSIWYKQTFNIGFNDLLFTLLSPIGGTGSSTVADIVRACVPPVVMLLPMYVIVAISLNHDAPIFSKTRKLLSAFCVILLVLAMIYTLFAFKIPEYLSTFGGTSELYEAEYVDPDKVEITDKDLNARNLIYIYLESMETTYASKDAGGEQDGINYMPHLTELAKNNVSFSDGEGLGGFRSITGTGWTMGALMGTTSGVPFSLSVFGDQSHNSQGKDGTFANGITAIGDVLEEKGYNNEFLCGSQASFGGRKTYFQVHGNYEIFDLQTARDKGYVPADYHNGFWGFEDKILYEIAKDEVTRLAAMDEPFNLTMLSVDLHHVGGYKCDLCGSGYEAKLGNIVMCGDKLLYEFIEWCKTQDFYKDTTIVIIGDHPRMDTQLVKGVDFYERTMYNCIINPAIDAPKNFQNRVFTSLDMFPTVLAAMGFEIEGERLGLGTNLFSPVPTLCEKNGKGREGYDWLDTEVIKRSDYYKKHFVDDKD